MDELYGKQSVKVWEPSIFCALVRIEQTGPIVVKMNCYALKLGKRVDITVLTLRNSSVAGWQSKLLNGTIARQACNLNRRKISHLLLCRRYQVPLHLVLLTTKKLGATNCSPTLRIVADLCASDMHARIAARRNHYPSQMNLKQR